LAQALFVERLQVFANSCSSVSANSCVLNALE